MGKLTFVNKTSHEGLNYYLGSPKVEVHHDCVYIPIDKGNFWTEHEWGVYGADGRIIDPAACRQLPNMGLRGQNETCLVDVSDAPVAPLDTYFYVGNMITHYGHCICTSMARLWALREWGGRNVPLLGHNLGAPIHWFMSPVIRILFNNAGVTEYDFAHFDRPTRIKKLIVPHPAFVELNHVYSTYIDTFHSYGDRLVKTINCVESDQIAYLSKSHSRPNPDFLMNEAEITSELEERGVRIIYPEQMTLPEQVAIFRTHKTIIGQSGSAFHTAIFSRPLHGHKYILMTSHEDWISSNHYLMDLANGHKSTYVNFSGEWHDREDALPGLMLDDPKFAAESLWRLANE